MILPACFPELILAEIAEGIEVAHKQFSSSPE